MCRAQVWFCVPARVDLFADGALRAHEQFCHMVRKLFGLSKAACTDFVLLDSSVFDKRKRCQTAAETWPQDASGPSSRTAACANSAPHFRGTPSVTSTTTAICLALWQPHAMHPWDLTLVVLWHTSTRRTVNKHSTMNGGNPLCYI